MLDRTPDKGSESDQTTRPHQAVTRSRPKVRKRRIVTAGTRGRLLFYGLPITAFVLILTLFVVKVSTVKQTHVPFQEFAGFQQADGLIDRDNPVLIHPPTETSPSQDIKPTITTQTTVTTQPIAITDPSSVLPETEPSPSDSTDPAEDLPEATIIMIEKVKTVFVIKELAEIYDLPAETSDILATAGLNNVLIKIGEADGWTSVRNNRGVEGFVRSNLVGETQVFIPQTGATYYVQNYQSNIRVGPGRQYETEGFGLRGMTLKVLEAGDEWSKVRTENGVSGYMLNDLFGPAKPAQEVGEIDRGRYMYVDTDVANLRDAPSLDSELIGAAFMDDRVYQVADNGGWSRVKTEGGITAYVNNDLLRATPPANPFQKTNRTFYVATSSVNVRSSPTTDSEVLERMKLDQAVLELEANDAWSKVKLSNGKIGFISSDLLTSVVPPPAGFKRTTGSIYVNTGAANIRSQPNTNCTIVTVARYGNKLTLKATGPDWSMIETSTGQTGYISNDLISKDKPAPPTTGSGTGSGGGTNNAGGTSSSDKDADARQRVVEIAKSCLGLPYRLGSSNLSAMDCSGLVKYCYGAIGYKNIPHGSDPQARQLGTRVTFTGRDFSNLLPGDLIFFSRGYGYHHVGIYIGNNKMIHAVSRRGVICDDLTTYSVVPVRVNRVLN
ncbi:MAG: SH3 domain-containing protein [Clostridiaceae bacterium]|nr:SH3 domain-containing protein [Clostridiaceae bacterium]